MLTEVRVAEGKTQSGFRNGFSLLLPIWCEKRKAWWKETERVQELRIGTTSDLLGGGRLGDVWKGRITKGDGEESA